MTNQAVGTGNTADILYFMRVLLFVALLSMGYQLSRPLTDSTKEQDPSLPDATGPSSQDQKWAGLPPWQKKASDRAIEKYTEAQEKKWRRWNEAMFERSV